MVNLGGYYGLRHNRRKATDIIVPFSVPNIMLNSFIGTFIILCANELWVPSYVSPIRTNTIT